MKNFIWIYITVFLNLIGIVGFWLAFKNKKNAVIAILILATLSLIISVVKICFQKNRELKVKEKELQQVQNELKDVKIRHKALSKQFNVKKHKLGLYEDNWAALNFVFINAIQSSDKDRFNTAYNLYKVFTNAINADKKGE